MSMARSSNAADSSRSRLLAFLAGGRSKAEDADDGSGEIVGILSGLKTNTITDKEHVVEEDQEETTEYEELTGAKKKEIGSLGEQIQSKAQRVGELAVNIAKDENELEDYEESLAEDKKLHGRLGAICDEKLKEFEENMRMRSLELKALADTIKLLSDDDAREMLKKAVPSSSSSFLQISVNSAKLRSHVRALLKQSQSPSARLDLLALAIHGKKLGLARVVKMVDDMKATLEKDQANDEAKKKYCEKEFDVSEDNRKEKTQETSDITAAVEEAKEELASIEERLNAAEAGIAEQDKSVQEATEQRQEEHAEYKELMATNAAAKDLLTKAADRMSKFYDSAETPVFTQLLSHTHRLSALRAAPKTAQEYSKSEGGGNVISAIKMIIADLDKETAVAKTEEENAQEEFEVTMEEAAAKRAADEKMIADHKAQRADLKSELGKHAHAKGEVEEEIAGLDKYITALHHECDFILKFFETRQDARNNEIDGLIKARVVLTSLE